MKEITEKRAKERVEDEAMREKMNNGIEYCFNDPVCVKMKHRASDLCAKLNAIPLDLSAEREEVVRELFAECGENVKALPNFNCDYGLNIFIGDDFIANYNVTILDRATVRIGNHVMIGPNTLISAVGHPLSPKGRREHMSISLPVTIGNDVWIGGNVTVTPGVTIGNNVVIAAGAVVTKDIPDNSLAGGIPARVLRTLDNDIPEGQEES